MLLQHGELQRAVNYNHVFDVAQNKLEEALGA